MKYVLIVSLLLGSTLVAKIDNMAPSFSDFDLNRDGKVTKVEFESTQQKRMKEKSEEGRLMRNIDNIPKFSDVDVNKNKAIDTREFSAYQSERRAKMRRSRAQENSF